LTASEEADQGWNEKNFRGRREPSFSGDGERVLYKESGWGGNGLQWQREKRDMREKIRNGVEKEGYLLVR